MRLTEPSPWSLGGINKMNHRSNLGSESETQNTNTVLHGDF